MGKNLKDALLDAGYESTGAAYWPTEKGDYVDMMIAEEGDHVVCLNEEGQYIGEYRFEEPIK